MNAGSFWQRIRDFAERKRHDAWMEANKHDRRCPRCLQWFGSNGSWISCWPEDNGTERICCESCGHQSVWYHDRSMLPVSDSFPPTTLTPSPAYRPQDGEGATDA